MTTHLIRLRDISEYTVHHADQHAVLKRVSCILDDGNDVCAGFGHVDQVSSRSVGELDGVNAA